MSVHRPCWSRGPTGPPGVLLALARQGAAPARRARSHRSHRSGGTEDRRRGAPVPLVLRDRSDLPERRVQEFADRCVPGFVVYHYRGHERSPADVTTIRTCGGVMAQQGAGRA